MIMTIITECDSKEEMLEVKEKYHHQLVGNKDYVESNIVLNGGDDNKELTLTQVGLYIFPESKTQVTVIPNSTKLIIGEKEPSVSNLPKVNTFVEDMMIKLCGNKFNPENEEEFINAIQTNPNIIFIIPPAYQTRKVCNLAFELEVFSYKVFQRQYKTMNMVGYIINKYDNFKELIKYIPRFTKDEILDNPEIIHEMIAKDPTTLTKIPDKEKYIRLAIDHCTDHNILLLLIIIRDYNLSEEDIDYIINKFGYKTLINIKRLSYDKYLRYVDRSKGIVIKHLSFMPYEDYKNIMQYAIEKYPDCIPYADYDILSELV